MLAAAAFLLVEGRGLSFSGDELYYYAEITAGENTLADTSGIEYLLSPHNGHLVFLGRVIYEALFAIAGTDYLVFRIAEVAGILVSVGLLFRLASRRIDPLLALAPCVLLLFLGYAWESLLWPFNLHTVYALAFGLAAILALEREDRKGDVLACLFLVLSVLTVEVGLAFVAGVAVTVLLREDRLRRLWIVLVPAALYGIWLLWASKFDHPSGTLLNIHLIPADIGNALTAVAGSLTGVNPTGPTVSPYTTGITPVAAVLAGALAAGIAFRCSRGKVPPQVWLVAATVVGYWITIALGGRAPDSARYIFVGAVLVLLVAAYCLEGVRISNAVLACVWIVVIFALPPNLAKFYDGRRVLLNDAQATRVEYAMFDLSRERVDPTFIPAADPRVAEIGGAAITPLSAGDYLRGSEDRGSLSYSLEQVREAPAPFPAIADATLVAGLGLELTPIGEPGDTSGCERDDSPSPDGPVAFAVPRGGVILGSDSTAAAAVGLRRFDGEGAGAQVGELAAGEWAELKIPSDSAPERWSVVVDQPVVVCPID